MSEEQSHTIAVSRTRQDYFLFVHALYSRVRNIRHYYIIAVFTVMVIYLLLFSLLVEKRIIPMWLLTNELALYAVGCAILFPILMLLRLSMLPLYRREYLNENQSFLRPHQLIIDEKGIRETSSVSESFMMWQGVDKIEKNLHFLLIYTDKLMAYTIPLRNFATPQQAEQFYENMLGYWHKANGHVSS